MGANVKLERGLWLVAVIVAAGCARPQGPAVTPRARWLGTWATALQNTTPRYAPPVPLAGAELLQVIHVSLGGPRIRLRLANTFGEGPLVVRSAQIARSLGHSVVEPATEASLRFDGADSVTIPTGGAVISDPLDYPLAPLTDYAIVLELGAVPASITGHPASHQISYIMPAGRDTTREPAPDSAAHWYVIESLDVAAAGAAVVTLGNSITDGSWSGTNRNDRWPDDLARRLQADPRTAQVSVLNAGIGGNRVLREGNGPSALDRLDRDVLSQSGVRWVILLEGVNDIGQAREPGSAEAVARDLIPAYRRIIARAHARGFRVYGATITPMGGSFYDSAEREAARQEVNRWIRTSGAFDAVIDFDAAVRDPANPHRLLPAADCGDHLHPNETGYQLMANAVELRLFR
jgi:lysophospholipase L1-like esterase